MKSEDYFVNLFLKDQCKRLIRKDLNALPESATIQEVISSIRENETDYVCILDDHKKFLGLITEKDIIRWVGTGDLNTAAPVSNIMLSDFDCCIDSKEPISNLVMRMYKNEFMHMPVTKDEKVVGVVSTRDFVNYLVDYFAENVYTILPGQPMQKKREGA
ncbi:MAG: CBS domain-containing protein [Candidatus Hodarchaeales archaeon]|jgi:signal-transduction protein with cAMP-binding, CBS, and nucleotidyltransferase domain